MNLLHFLESVPAWVLLANSIILAALIILILFHLVSSIRFMKLLKRCAEREDIARSLLPGICSGKQLIARSLLIERAARRYGSALIALSGIDKIWLRRLERRPAKTVIRSILEFSVDQGLYHVLQSALQQKKTRMLFLKWINSNGTAWTLQQTARSTAGRPFDGRAARTMLYEQRSIIAEMTASQEWQLRYFAVNILASDGDPHILRIMIDCLEDPHPLIRQTLIEQLPVANAELEKFLAKLQTLYLDDPAREVRLAARTRFRILNTKSISLPASLNPVQKLHVAELFDPESAEDEATAMEFLENGNAELKLAAARYLLQRGTLKYMLAHALRQDKKAFGRTRLLLKNAAESGISGFLNVLDEPCSPSTLYLTAELLTEHGKRPLIRQLAAQVFALDDREKKSATETCPYPMTMRCIIRRGNDEARSALCTELARTADSRDLQDIILNEILKADPEFLSDIAPQLMRLLHKPEYPCFNTLRRILTKTPKDIVLPELISSLGKTRNETCHKVRVEMFRLLTELKEPGCFQFILENLHILPNAEASEFTGLFSGYDELLFRDRARDLLQSHDARVRSALILCLPPHLRDFFLKEIEAALKDQDPDVRIAAIWALKDIHDIRITANCIDLLRDPLERVRQAAGNSLASHGNDGTLHKLKEVLVDPNEVEPVKKAIINGLGASERPESSSILTELETQSAALETAVINALSRKNDNHSIRYLLKNSITGNGEKAKRIRKAIEKMDADAEQILLDLHQSPEADYLPLIRTILENRGYIEFTIRQLNHRDPQLRKQAAARLAVFPTPAAYRGLVLAARDPNSDVRVEVVKALKLLDSTEGREILDELENDPDKRVRKYTGWSLERIRKGEL